MRTTQYCIVQLGTLLTLRGLNTELKLLNDFLVKNGHFFHRQKTECALFGSSPRLSSVTGFSVSVDGHCTKLVREYQYLGVIMDETLSWKARVKSLVSKIGKSLGMFNRIRKDITTNKTDILYRSFILPIANYCSAVCKCCGKINTDRFN